jgi:hypothetical protein
MIPEFVDVYRTKIEEKKNKDYLSIWKVGWLSRISSFPPNKCLDSASDRPQPLPF